METTKTVRRMLNTEVKTLDEKEGICEYVASDETQDNCREIIKASGWRFNHFAKNSPLLDSHDTSSIEKCVGKVIDFRVSGDKLIETAQWACNVAENRLAQIGWAMTKAGFLNAVSVGFWPNKWLSQYSNPDEYAAELKRLGKTGENGPRRIFVEQEQCELSAVILGANPNALARAYKAEVIGDDAIDLIGHAQTAIQKSFQETEHGDAGDAFDAALASEASERECQRFLDTFERFLKRLDK